MNKDKLRYIAYLRKSTDEKDRQILSLLSQKKAIQEQFSHLNIVEWVSEKGSAFEPDKRSEFDRIIKQLDAGELHGIVGWHPDRLSRNEIEAAAITYRFRKGTIKDLKFCSYHLEHTIGETPDPDTIKHLQDALSMAQHKSAQQSKDVKRGLDDKREMGWRPSFVPLGYLNDPHSLKGEKKVFVDKERWKLVRKCWDMLLSGSHTVPAILEAANDEMGLRTREGSKRKSRKLSKSVLYGIFHNIFYTGNFYDENGELVKGKHKPMITMPEYERAQLLLGAKGKPAPHTHQHAYTGAIWCGECGGQVTAELKRHVVCSKCHHKFGAMTQRACPNCDTDIGDMVKSTIREYIYYHCGKNRQEVKCTQGAVQLPELERQIDEYLKTIQLDPDYLAWAIKHLRKAHALEAETQKDVLKSQQEKYRKSSERMNRINELLLDGHIEPDEARGMKEREKAEQEKWEGKIKETKHRQHNWLELSEATFNFATYSRFWYADAIQNNDLQRKREILTTLGSNLTLKDKILHLEAPEPFNIIAEALKEMPEAKAAENATFEPTKTPVFVDDRAREATPVLVSPEWSG